MLIFHLIAARARLAQIEKTLIVRRTPIQPPSAATLMVGTVTPPVPLILLTAGEVTGMGEAIKGEGGITRVRHLSFFTKNFRIGLKYIFLIGFQKSHSVVAYSQHDSRFRSPDEIQEDWLKVKSRDVDYERFILI